MHGILKAMFCGMTGDATRGGSRIAAHLPTLSVLSSSCPENSVLVECGVGRGWSTIALLSGIAGKRAVLHSYDTTEICRKYVVERAGIQPSDPLYEKWKFKACDSVAAANGHADGSVSLFFLDTSHEYDRTKQELLAWEKKMSQAGIICGHDYLLHLRWGDRAGVKKAVDEFVSRSGGRYLLQMIPSDDGLFILWPKQ